METGFGGTQMAQVTHGIVPIRPKDMDMVNRVQSLCKARGWDKNQFKGYCLAEIGIGHVTSEKIWNGDTGITLRTIKSLARLFRITDINQIIELKVRQ